MKITNGNGVDYAIESAGRKDTMEMAFQAVRNGGKCIIAGNLAIGEKITIDPMDLIKHKQIVGTWGGETNPDHDIPMYVDHYLSGKFNLDLFISDIYSLNKINNSFKDLAAGNVNRALIKFD